MSGPIITVEKLGKRYTLRHQARSGLLRDKLASLLRNPFRQVREARATAEDFWALRDVSFSVNQGDVLGIIGRNGAGKSTLLKILSRITEPTIGRISIQGRVASLLEVGTGFHGELSGRENIFLNGAILGMKRAEIHQKFDEIVAFAEVEKFLDTPVKHYSSGMYVRLAFAVAAHLEPEILIVDEVLAVGDHAFQRKCLGKMQEVSSAHGRTVLFVSHNTSALHDICRTGVWLKNGKLEYQGPIHEAVNNYLKTGAILQSSFTAKTGQAGIEFVELDSNALREGHLEFAIGFKSPVPLQPPVVGIVIFNKIGQPVCGANTRMTDSTWNPPSSTSGIIRARLPSPPLQTDTYRVSVWLGDAGQDYDHKNDALVFDFLAPSFHLKSPPAEVVGPLNLKWHWQWQSDKLI